MQEDKQLKELLQKWAVENPSADFTHQVMQRVTPVAVHNLHTPPLSKRKVPQMLFVTFILVCIALFILCFASPAAILLQFKIQLPLKYITQGFTFITVFWIVMLFNLAIKKLQSGTYTVG